MFLTSIYKYIYIIFIYYIYNLFEYNKITLYIFNNWPEKSNNIYMTYNKYNFQKY